MNKKIELIDGPDVLVITDDAGNKKVIVGKMRLKVTVEKLKQDLLNPSIASKDKVIIFNKIHELEQLL